MMSIMHQVKHDEFIELIHQSILNSKNEKGQRVEVWATYFIGAIVHLELGELQGGVEIDVLCFETGCLVTFVEISHVEHFQEKWQDGNERRRQFAQFDQQTNTMEP